MNKLQASQYLYGKGPGASVKASEGRIWTLLESGNVMSDENWEHTGLPSDTTYSTIEPEKSNEELAREASEVWGRTVGVETLCKFLLDVMDRKIRGVK